MGCLNWCQMRNNQGIFINLYLQEVNSNESIYFFVDYYGMFL